MWCPQLQVKAGSFRNRWNVPIALHLGHGKFGPKRMSNKCCRHTSSFGNFAKNCFRVIGLGMASTLHYTNIGRVMAYVKGIYADVTL
jgi:hypothetical protein